MNTVGSGGLWAGFAILVLAMLWMDLVGVRRGKAHRVTFGEAALWSAIWVGTALAFAGLLWWRLDLSLGREAANARTLAFVTGYLIEKALSVDNVFVWMMLFAACAIPPELQKRVLTYGVIGAVAMRTAMIFGGVWLIGQFHWLLYVFGAFLLYTGIRMWQGAAVEHGAPGAGLAGWLRRRLRMSETLHGDRFFVDLPVDGKSRRYATPLLFALVLVEVSDLIFALDSIPAVLAVSLDPFVVLTSNVFAILGLRAMYFLLSGMAERFALLKYGLAVVLVLVGGKMMAMDWLHVPVWLSLVSVAGILAASVLLSLLRERRSRV